jgi:glycosyltransferase involved in cell wall biosynthesis
MISVVILAYDSGRTIEACLESLAAQDPRPAEILLVDDDSSDDTVAKARALAGRTGLLLRVLRNGTHNISHGRNVGLDAAHGPVVAFVDSDAVVEPGWTKSILDTFNAASDIAVVGGEVVTAHASPFAEAVALNDATVRELFTRGELLVSGCNMALRTDLLGGERFDPAWVHAEDVEFVDRIKRRHRWGLALGAVARHESRSTPRGYLSQMYRYGLWKVRYARTTGNIRPVDYVPSAVLACSAVAGVIISPWLLLAHPALCVAETAFVALYRRAPVRLWPLMLAGWMVKNTGWGAGVLVAIAQQAAGAVSRRQPAWAR